MKNSRNMSLIRKPKQSMWFMTLLFSALVVITYLLLGARLSFPWAYEATHVSNSVQINDDNNELERILKRAATKDKTVIVTCLNNAWAARGSVFDLQLESFRVGNDTKRLLKHMIVVSFDYKAHHHCHSLKLNCYFLQLQDFNLSGEATFKTSNYLEIIWRKVHFLHTVLSLGYNLLFTDTDILWFRDPFIHFEENVDLQVSSDLYNGNPTSFANRPNTGFMYVKSNKRTILFFNFWYYSRNLYNGKHEQEVFDVIKLTSLFKAIGLKVKFLDTNFFAGLCRASKDFSQVCTVHANCCVGLEHKVHDLKLILSDWRKYSSSPQNAPRPFKWSAPKLCQRPQPQKKP